jgi:hypothetical protein
MMALERAGCGKMEDGASRAAAWRVEVGYGSVVAALWRSLEVRGSMGSLGFIAVFCDLSSII